MPQPFTVKSPFATLSIDSDLRLASEGFEAEARTRTLRDMLSVLRDSGKLNFPEDTILYRMYRSFARPSDLKIFRFRHIRHDITIMASLCLGSEPNKTLGHYHPAASKGISYPEIYSILHGEATYLLQKEHEGKIIDFVAIEAKQGDALVIPPNYGHVTINTGDAPLVMANLVSDRFNSIYAPYQRKFGAAYYLLSDGRLEPNPKYGILPEPRRIQPNFKVSKDLYDDFLACPSCYEYLNNPLNMGKLGRL